MSKQLLEQYADIKLKIKQLEEQCEMMQPDVLKFVAAIMDEHDMPVEIEGKGTLVVYPRRSWKYTAEYEDMKKRLEDRKKEEQAKGWAEVEEVPTLKFNPLE